MTSLSSFTQRRHFTVSTVHYRPWQNIITDGNGTVRYSGITFDILNALAESLNFNYEVKEPDDGVPGREKDNGIWSGIVGQIARNEADIGIAPVTITESRFEVVDFMSSFWQDSLTFVIKVPDESKWMIHANLFKIEVWWSIISTVIVVALINKFLDELHKRIIKTTAEDMQTKNDGIAATLFQSYGNMINQGSHYGTEKVSSRVLSSCYWFFIITTLAIYSGNLVAFSTIKKLQLPVSNLKELADNEEYSAAVPCGSSTLNLFKYSQAEVYKKIWENNINKNQKNSYNSSDESMKSLMERLHSEKLVGIGELSSLQYILIAGQYCDIAFSKDTFYSSSFSFPVYKNFSYLEMFNRRILQMVEAGLVQKWYRSHFPRENKCDKSLSSFRHGNTGMEKTKGAFVALSIGLSLALLVFIVEVLVTKACRKSSKTLRIMS